MIFYFAKLLIFGDISKKYFKVIDFEDAAIHPKFGLLQKSTYFRTRHGNCGVGEVMEDLGEGGDGGLGIEWGDVEGGMGQPGELFFCVYAGVFGDASYGGGAVERSVEVTKPFFEADGVEGIEVSQWVHALCFLFHAVGYHLEDTRVDAVEELRSWHGEGECNGVQLRGGRASGEVAAVRASGLEADFDGVYYAACIGRVYGGSVLRVESGEEFEQVLQSVSVV